MGPPKYHGVLLRGRESVLFLVEHVGDPTIEKVPIKQVVTSVDRVNDTFIHRRGKFR